MQRIKVLALLAVTTLAVTVACAPKEETEESTQRLKQETREAVEAVTERFNVEKEAVQRQVGEQLKAIDQKLEVLAAQLDEKGEQGRVAVQKEIQELEETAKALRKKAGVATGGAWKEIKRGVGAAADKAQDAFKETEQASRE